MLEPIVNNLTFYMIQNYAIVDQLHYGLKTNFMLLTYYPRIRMQVNQLCVQYIMHSM